MVVPAGAEAAALAPLPIALVARLAALDTPARPRGRAARRRARGRRGAAAAADVPLALWRRWGLATLGALAALPAADLFERLGAAGLAWHAMARGLDARPLVPTAEPRPFEATCAFEWPIEAIEPLSFALGRVIDPLCARLDHDGLGTVTLQTTLRLVTRELYVRRLGLPMPMRDPKVLRTLIVLDLESHPPPAGIDVLTVTFEPVAGRIVQPSLLARAHPPTRDDRDADRPAARGDGRRPRRQPGRARHAPRRGDRDAAVRRAGGGAAARRRRDAVDDGARRGRRRPADAAPVPAAAAGPRRARSRAAGARAIARAAAAAAAELRVARCGSPPVRGDRRATGGGPSAALEREPAVPSGSAIGRRAAATPSVWQPDPSVWSDEPTTAWDDDEWDVVLESGTALRLARDWRRDAWVVAALID